MLRGSPAGMTLKAPIALLVLTLCGLERVDAQVVPADSILRHHIPGEIIVRGQGESAQQRAATTMQRVPLAAIAGADAPAIDGALRRIAGLHLQTNSRGETLAYLRGAGERQMAVYFDGALLNVPWDNRIDLSLVPAEVVGEIMVSKGVPSVLYGTNVLGGALNMTSNDLSHPGRYTHMVASAGSMGSRRANLAHLGRRRKLSYALSGGVASRNAFAVSRSADLPYSQDDTRERTNTDRESFNLFGRITYGTEEGSRFGLSFLRVDGKKGVAPEGHVDPREAPVRFWRYPDWTTSMAIATARIPLRGAQFRGTFWGSTFDQRIVQYEGAGYASRKAQQEDEDNTLGTRLALEADAGPGQLSLAVNALTSRHRQIDADFGPASNAVMQTFRQHVWSSGVEYSFPGVARMVLGASLDGIATPETGNKSPRSAQVNYGLNAGFVYVPSQAWTIRAVGGRKVRFPTMRELFGDALGRFLVNENLRAESSVTSEVAVALDRDRFRTAAVVFYQRTYDTIDQRMVEVKGEDVPRRQRVNLDGSRVTGIELDVASRVVHGLDMEGNLTWMRPRAQLPGRQQPLVERPAILGLVSMTYRHASGFSAVLEGVYTGQAHGLAPDNDLVPLASSLVFSTRVAMLMLSGRRGIQLYGRLNNVTDEVVLPQLGLPGPGREAIFGIDITF